MPTPPPACALLELALTMSVGSDPFDHPAPWYWDQWRNLTDVQHPPWVLEADPEDVLLDEDKLAAIRAFVHKYYAHSSADARLRFYRKSEANFEGRDALREWVGDRWKSWGVNTIIDEAMAAHGRTMYSVATPDGSSVSCVRRFTIARAYKAVFASL